MNKGKAFRRGKSFNEKHIVAINKNISLLSRRKKLQEAKCVFDEAMSRGHVNNFSFSIMANAYVRCGKPEKAETLLKKMKKSVGVSPAVVEYTSLINGYCKQGISQ